MKKLSLVLLAFLCTGALLPAGAAEIPIAAPALASPACAAVSSASGVPAPSLPDFMAPERSTATCPASVVCRCGQRLSCTSAVGDCQRILGCSVTCDGNEQVCPPCHGFACF